MFEGFLQRWLTANFGDYLTGIDAENLQISVWAGDITVKNVDINPKLIKKYTSTYYYLIFFLY